MILVFLTDTFASITHPHHALGHIDLERNKDRTTIRSKLERIVQKVLQDTSKAFGIDSSFSTLWAIAIDLDIFGLCSNLKLKISR